jgi:hypothetical protein
MFALKYIRKYASDCFLLLVSPFLCTDGFCQISQVAGVCQANDIVIVRLQSVNVSRWPRKGAGKARINELGKCRYPLPFNMYLSCGGNDLRLEVLFTTMVTCKFKWATLHF